VLCVGQGFFLLMLAPVSGNREGGGVVSRLLALRSRALSNLQQHELALRDTQLALSGGVPDSYARAQLLRTQGRCYYSLGDQMRCAHLFYRVCMCANYTYTFTEARNIDVYLIVMCSFRFCFHCGRF